VTDFHEVRHALAAARRAIHATRFSLTEQARRDVHVYLSCEAEDDAAAAEWYEMALAPRNDEEEPG